MLDEPYYGSAAPLVPPNPTYAKTVRAAKGCQACHLWRIGTQTVFGEGPTPANLMLVGEQPGDKEDLAGHPFVGPAGRILDEALEAAGLKREEVYLTNAVKHFKWVPKGERRLHQKPNRGEIQACHPWLEAELEIVKPKALVLLGATAAQAILGPKFKLTQNRGKFIESDLAEFLIPTLHPSAVLRVPDRRAREEALEGLISDLRLVASKL
ncbi:MAG: UdgX family uracil-DNA binding protein [Fimbriimonas sp.]